MVNFFSPQFLQNLPMVTVLQEGQVKLDSIKPDDLFVQRIVVSALIGTKLNRMNSYNI